MPGPEEELVSIELAGKSFADPSGPQSSAEEEEEIVVTGTRLSDSSILWSWDGIGGSSDPSDPTETDASITPNSESEPADEDQVTIEITFEPTEEQKKMIEAYMKAIDRADKAIRGLADDARIRLPNGTIVTGYELKQFWAKTDFVINPEKTTYANGSQRGEAAYNNGNPQISINMDNLTGFWMHGDAGLNYVILHEVGHLTAANRAFDFDSSNPQDAVERMANDIARAISHNAGIAMLPASGEQSPQYGYSTQDPLIFTSG